MISSGTCSKAGKCGVFTALVDKWRASGAELYKDRFRANAMCSVAASTTYKVQRLPGRNMDVRVRSSNACSKTGKRLRSHFYR